VKKILHKTAVVFMFVDGVDKVPIINVNILCNNKKVPFIIKDDGYIVFSNLEYNNYNFQVFSPGFFAKNYNIEVKKKNDAPLIIDIFQRNNLHPRNGKKILIEIKKDGKTVPNLPVFIMQETKINTLKILEPVLENNEYIKLNSSYNLNITYQKYFYEKIEDFITINEFNHSVKLYVLNKATKKLIPGDGVLKPVWELFTDKFGVLNLPVNKLFMENEEVELKLKFLEQEKNIQVKTSGSEFITLEI